MPRKQPPKKREDAPEKEVEEATPEVAEQADPDAVADDEAEAEVETPKKAKKGGEAMSAMARARAVVNKLYEKKKEESPFVDTNELTESCPHIPTGSFVLNYLIGGIPNAKGILPCPGWPRARIVQAYGKESSGKTTLALLACAELCSHGEPVLYVDFEQAIDLQYAKKLGVPVDNEELFQLVQPRTLEEGLQIIVTYATCGVAMIVIDSVGAGVPSAIATRALDETGNTPQVAAVARFWSVNVPQIATIISRTQTTVFAISQTRKQISANPGSEDVVQGGTVWAFYASVRIGLKHQEFIKSNRLDLLRGSSEKMALANRVMAVVRKSKVSPNQNRSGDLFFAYGSGVDNLASAFQIAVRSKIISKGGAIYTWVPPKGGEIKEKGEDKFKMEVRRRGLTDLLIKSVVNYLSSQTPNLDSDASDDDEDLAGADMLESL